MVDIPTLGSTLLMGIFLVVVAGALVRFGSGRRVIPYEGDSETTTGLIVGLTEQQMTWIVAFVLLVVGFGGGVVTFLGAGFEPGAVLVMALALAAIVGGFFVVGSYHMVRSHGRSVAEAVFVGAWALATLFVIGIAIQLLLQT